MPSNSRHILRTKAPSLPKTVVARSAVACPTCARRALRAGMRKTKRGVVQKYYCPGCDFHFSAAPLPRRHYSPAVILNAVTLYNLGGTLEAVRREISRRHKVQVPQSTLHAWLGQFSRVCTFLRHRRRFSLDADTLVTHAFQHRQEYRFAFHRLKANLLCKRRFPELRRYLWRVKDICPNRLFVEEDNGRCSQAPVKTAITARKQPDNNAVALARLGLMLAKRATERHESVERFMIANDSATVAVEIPVWLYPNEAPDLGLSQSLTGHIDILQVRGDALYILDFKPDARHETKAKHQLYLYSRALAVRTGIPLSRIRLAYFDERDYFAVASSEFAA